MLHLLLIMATLIASNIPGFNSLTGTPNQSHLIYAPNQQRWWLFLSAFGDYFLSSYVSNSSDLSTASWSPSTDSPVIPNGHIINGVQRNLGVLAFANGATDVLHAAICDTESTNDFWHEHIRATFTGAASITWESWDEFDSSCDILALPGVIGVVIGVSTPSKYIHETSLVMTPTGETEYQPYTRLSVNGDTTGTWTNSWNAAASPYLGVDSIASYALAPLASDGMLLVFGNGAVAQTATTGLRYVVYSSGSTWPTTGSADVGVGSSSQNQNDMCLVPVDTTHIFVIRRDSASTTLMRMFDGSTWSDKTPAPAQNHKANSGFFAVPRADGTAFYLFLLDSAGLQAVYFNKYTLADDSWGTWTLQEGAGTATRHFISGCPYVGGSDEIGVIFSEVNGGNFDVYVSAFDTITEGPSLTTQASYRSRYPKVRMREVDELGNEFEQEVHK